MQRRSEDTIDGEPLPRQFGPYTLLSRLSTGGMAELFLALQRSAHGFEKLVVIKRILPSKSHDRAFIDMLLHEARVAATLAHPNIVQTFDAGEIDGTYFIAMEHVHGEDVHAIMRMAKLHGTVAPPLELALGVVLGVLAGLAYVHEKGDLRGVPLGIVHRDISPRNIVVSFTGEVKIIDFGIARSEIEDDDSGQELKGKIRYMSPEQAAGEQVDHRADLFAAGVVLFEMTTGQRLFKPATDVQTLFLVCESRYARPSEIVPDYPPALERIIVRALEKKREDRYPSAREMLSDLTRFVRQEQITTSPARITAAMQSLFEDKLARHKRAVLGVRRLVDTVITREDRWGLDVPPSTTSTALSTTTTGGATPATTGASRSFGAATLAMTSAIASAVTVVAGFVYTQHEMSARQAEFLRLYREEQGLRQQATAPATAAKGIVEITSKPPGCAIWLNGALRPELSPAKLDQLPLDRELHIKLVKPGFDTYRTVATLRDEAPFAEVLAEMKPTPAVVLLQVEPPAGVWVDGKAWKGDRSTLDPLSPDEDHRIVISASGYLPKVMSLRLQPGETKSLQVRLVRAQSPRDDDPPPTRASPSTPSTPAGPR